MGSYDPYTFIRRQHLQDVDWQEIDGAHVDPELLKLGGYDVPIYRYVHGSPEATAMLDHQSLRFDHPTVWSDPYEHYVAQELFSQGAPFGKMAIYAKCFTYHYASEAFWRINAGRVRMRFQSLRALIRSLAGAARADGQGLPNLFVGRVRYMDQSDLRQAIGMTRLGHAKPVSRLAAEAVLLKRIGFSHENEIRIFYVGDEAVVDSKALDVKLACPAPVEELLVGPYLPNGQEGALSRYFFFGEIVECAERHQLKVSDSEFNLKVKPKKLQSKINQKPK